MKSQPAQSAAKVKSVSYAKWGYIFILPFFIVFAIFTLIPLFSTFYYSFFEKYSVGLTEIGPNFVGLANYISVFTEGDLMKYIVNTLLLWIMCFIPQIAVSMLLAVWFTDLRLRLRGTTFFKSVMYMPNMIMAAAFSMLFFALFSPNGPINDILINMGLFEEPYRFFSHTWSTRIIIAFMNFLMWFGNTTILVMAAIMGISTSIFEAAEIDGATSRQAFTKITLPLMRPILVYVLITSLIGGLQLFDVPQILTNGNGSPNRETMTLVMYLNKHLYSENLGMAGAVSVFIFIVAGALSVLVMHLLRSDDAKEEAHNRKLMKRALKRKEGVAT
jgi:multiple sugar transport system permease protein